MKKLFEALVNNKKLCKGVIYGCIVLNGVTLSVLTTATHALGVRQGFDIADESKEEN